MTIGFAAATVLGDALSSVLYGVTAYDAGAYLGVALVLFAVGALASLVFQPPVPRA